MTTSALMPETLSIVSSVMPSDSNSDSVAAMSSSGGLPCACTSMTSLAKRTPGLSERTAAALLAVYPVPQAAVHDAESAISVTTAAVHNENEG